jgi:DNA-binding transcriptional ArsR family regulator
MLNEISPHLVKVHRALAKKPPHWLTNQEIGALLPDVAARTIRYHTRRLTAAGVLEERRVFGGYRYRYAATPDQEAVAQLNSAAAIFGLG